MQARLKKRCHRGLLMLAGVAGTLLLARICRLLDPVDPQTARFLAPWLFVLAVVLAVALPVLLRSLFAHRMRTLRFTPPAEFYRLQRRLLDAALAAMALLPVACVVEMPAFYQGGVILAALYAVYYHYPTSRRLAFDRRVFRVSNADDHRSIQD